MHQTKFTPHVSLLRHIELYCPNALYTFKNIYKIKVLEIKSKYGCFQYFITIPQCIILSPPYENTTLGISEEESAFPSASRDKT